MKKIYVFSLIELIVIIITLALIAGLLLPALSRAREQARRSSCKGNLKNIGLMCKMYAQDYNDIWPFEEQKGTNARQNLYLLFTTDIADHIGLFFCPSSDTWKHVDVDYGDGDVPSDFEYTDYAYLDGEGPDYEDRKLSGYQTAPHWTEAIVVMGDAWQGHSDPSDDKWTHDNGSNTLWGDGHIQWCEQKYVGIHGPYTNVK